VSTLFDQTTTDDFLSLTKKATEVSADVDWVITQRKQEYVPKLIVLKDHKSKAVRQKIAKNLDKLVPLQYLEELKAWQAAEPDREAFLALESLIDRITRGSLHETDADARIYSVDEVITLLKRMLGDREYIIEGELGEYKPMPGSQVVYFGLKGSADDAINCMAMRFLIDRLTFPMNTGLKLRITGQFKIGKNARLYFQIKHIELTGEGELLRNFLLLQSKLMEEGLFDQARKRAIPTYPRKVLLIASPNSAALTDYLKVFRQRRGGVVVYHLPIKTQGIGAEEEILEALSLAQNLISQYGLDLVVMTRGGGASEELHVFNSERVVRALYGLKAPAIVAIGHERDTTLAELVADLRCSTPSQAAERSSLSRQELILRSQSVLTSITQSVQLKQRSYASVADQLMTMIVRACELQISGIKIFVGQVLQLGARIVAQARAEVSANTQELYHTISRTLVQIRYTLPDLVQLSKQTTTVIVQLRTLLAGSVETLITADPRQVLKRGFALLQDGDQVVDTIAGIHKDRGYNLLLRDGSVSIYKK
jgi:exodeoxyribonuclease VII large subunit